MKQLSLFWSGIHGKGNALKWVGPIVLMFYLFCTTSVFSAKVYNEVGGIVMMEAENTESSLDLWKTGSVAGSSGSGNIEFTGNSPEGAGSQRSPLLYKFKINTGGDYMIAIRGRRSDQFTETRKDIANDAYIRVEGDYTLGTNGPPDLKYLKEDAKIFVGRGGYQDATATYDWRWGSKLDMHGLATQPNAVYHFKAGETYTLVLSGRSTYFCVDRIVFFSTTGSEAAAKALLTESSSFDDGEEVERYSYDAVNHFDEWSAGEVPFYEDAERNALAIDASQVAYRGLLARATTVFTGKSDKYDVTLTTLGESDGECSYRFLVNGIEMGSYQNEAISSVDAYAPQTVVFKAVQINKNDILAIEANTHTNGSVPEGTGTAWARGRWRNVSMSKAVFQGRVAVVADGNYRDSDDIIGTPVSLAILRAFGLEKQLVHYSHSCDLEPGSNDPGGEYRENEMQLSCDGTAARWGGFEHLTFFNCIRQKQATIDDLTAQINASTETDPLWIIEAGEPDIMWEAVNNCDPAKRDFIFIVTHHPANDVGDTYDLVDVMNLGIPGSNLHQIPDQNTLLKSPLSDWYWARDHEDERLKWLWERGERAQSSDMNYPAIVGKFDCSDAGMLYYWATLPSGGDVAPDVEKLKTLFLDYVTSNPLVVGFVKPSFQEIILPGTDLVVEAELTVDAAEINSVTLFINDVEVRTIVEAPFIWGGEGDTPLKNMLPGTYQLKLVALDNNLASTEVSTRVEVPGYATIVSPLNGDLFETGSDLVVEAGLNADPAIISHLELFLNDVLVREVTTAPFIWGEDDTALKNMEKGVYVLKLVTTTNNGESSEETITLTVDDIPVQAPFSDLPFEIPGKFEAEDYDLGGEGLAYHDSDDVNQTGEYRTDGVDIGTGGSGYVIGYTIEGEWLEYAVNVSETKEYSMAINYASGRPGGGAIIGVEFVDGPTVLETEVALPVTSSWATYEHFHLGDFTLIEGEHVLRITVVGRGFNLDWIAFRDGITSINTIVDKSFSVYPNPSKDGYFTLDQSHSWEVYDLCGTKILEGNGKVVNISSASAGLYILKAGNSRAKLVIE